MILKKINFLAKIFFVAILFVSFSNNIKAEEESQDLQDIILKIQTISKDLKTLETAFYKTQELSTSCNNSIVGYGIAHSVHTFH